MSFTGQEAAGRFALPKAGLYPWVSARYSYAGWVPTISGNMSFSLVGAQANPKLCSVLNRDVGEHKRVVCVFQKRQTNDFLLPASVMKFFRPGIEGHFLLLAKTTSASWPKGISDGEAISVQDEMGALRGKIYFFPREEDRSVRQEVKGFFCELRNFVTSCERPKEVLEDIFQLINLYQGRGVTYFCAEFALFRSGEFRLWSDESFYSGDGAEEGFDEDSKLDSMSSQMYFFIKDLTHLHYHHSPDSDQILLLTRLETAKEFSEHKNNEVAWRRNTLWGLTRVALQFRRKNDLYSYKQALGVIAYAEAFQLRLSRIIRPLYASGGYVVNNEIHDYDFQQTRASVEAVSGVESWLTSGRIQLYGILVAAILSLIGIFVAAIPIAREVCKSVIGEPSQADLFLLTSYNTRSVVRPVVDCGDAGMWLYYYLAYNYPFLLWSLVVMALILRTVYLSGNGELFRDIAGFLIS